MKKIFLVTAYSIFAMAAVNGQFSKEFGKVGRDEIELEHYAHDKEADAVVLFDIGKSYFVLINNSFDVIHERSTRIKILSESGIEWANVEIPFYQEGNIYERIYDIEAYTYNFEDGQLTKTRFDINNTYDEKVNAYWNVKKFAMPNAKKGSIVEYRYKVRSQYKFNLRDWEFQWRIPVVYSEYEVKMIPFYEYTWLLQGRDRFDSHTSNVCRGASRQFGSINFQDMIHMFVMNNIPAFKNEEFISSINDYIIKLDFQLSKINYPNGSSISIITTWEDLIKKLLKDTNFGKYSKRLERRASKLISIQSPTSTEKEKYNYILDYVKTNYSWDNRYARFASKSPKIFVDDKHGNSADINLFTIALLRSNGIEAYPVLISTRDHGKIKYDYPFSHFFNYVIILAHIDGESVLSDATEILCLNDRIPQRCINDRGLVIKKGAVEWIGLECHFPSEVNTEIIFEELSSAFIKTNITLTTTEYDALHYRINYTDRLETILERISSKDYSVIDSSVIVQNQGAKELPYILKYSQISVPDIIDNKIYLSPFQNRVLVDNPLKQNIREYPIDMTYPKKRSFEATILIPENYQVDFIPDGRTISNDIFDLKYTASVEDKHIKVHLEYYFKRSVYGARDYQRIKFYFQEIIKKGNEKIVLSQIALNDY